MADLIETLKTTLRREMYEPDEDARADALTNQFRDDLVTSIAHAVIAALKAAGMTVVPVEPSYAMADAGGHAVQEVIAANDGKPSEYASDHAENIYRAMLSACGVKENEESV